MGAVTVGDPADERLADYRHLHPGRRKLDAAGARAGVVIVEGLIAVRRLLRSPLSVRSVLLTPNRLAALEADLADAGVTPLVVERDLVAGIAGFHVHRGVLAAADRPPPRPAADVCAAARTVAVLEAVSDHENLGALFRSAAALGIDGVLLCPRSGDPLYRRSVRVSLGHVLDLPFARLEPWPAGLADLQRRGFRIVALTPGGEEVLDDLGGHDRVALLLGSEGAGLTAEARGAADHRVRIAMAPGADSLNVAAAAAIAFHHLGRRR